MPKDAVLVLTARDDFTADLVVTELGHRGVPVVRIDTAEFPLELSMNAALTSSGWGGELRTSRRALDLESVRSVYYRRPSAFRFPEGMSAPARQFAEAEARSGFGGVLMSLSCPWINHPSRIADAEYKPLQLKAARECGFIVPATLITNNEQAVRDFAAETGRIVCKPLRRPAIVEDDQVKAVYTRLLDPADLHDLSGVDTTAHLFQAWVPKTHDVRVTVVGERLLATTITSGSDATRVDWRRDYDALTYNACEVPAGVIQGIRDYRARFGLLYGAFDFAVDADGAWWFLECNPNGQWGWLVESANLPIPAALADALAEG